MDREEILKILSSYDLTEEEQEYLYLQLYLTEQLNSQGDSQIQEFHKQQKDNRDSILTEIAKIMLSYPIIDSTMAIGKADKFKLKSRLSTLVQNKIQSEVNSETIKTKELLESTGKNKNDINNYVQSLGDVSAKESKGKYIENEELLKTPKDTNSPNVSKETKVSKDKPIEDTLDQIINKKVENKTWSDRLWANKNELQKDLKNEIDNFLNGKTTVNEIEGKIKKKFNSDAYETKRLVQTEIARTQSEINEVWAKEHGIEYQLFMATLDFKTSEICKGFDGKTFKLSDLNKPIPPLHPFCRSTLVNLPSKDWRPKERIDNITKERIDYQTYDEWKKKYVKNEKSDIIKENSTKDSKFIVNREYINSDEYEPKFDNVGSKKQNKVVFKETKKLIKDNDMKNTEGVSIIDGKGNVILSQKVGSYGGSVNLSCLDGLPNNSTILTHNHPLSTSFSNDDIALLLDNPQIKTIIAGGHNGTVYKLSVGKGTRTGISDLTGRNSIIQEYNNLLRNNLKPNEIVNILSKKYNWKYEVI